MKTCICEASDLLFGFSAVFPSESCKAYSDAFNSSGLQRLSPSLGGCEFLVFCDVCVATAKGRGWIIIQRRNNSDDAFESKGWEDYRNGFGDYYGNYWMGLEKIHQITSSGDYDLFIGFTFVLTSTRKYGYYTKFKVDSMEAGYKLNYDQFDAENSYSGLEDGLEQHRGHEFSTHDQDNDGIDEYDCAEGNGLQHGGWWFGRSNSDTSSSVGSVDSCYSSNLNGRYYDGSTANEDGIRWRGISSALALQETIMAIRKAEV